MSGEVGYAFTSAHVSYFSSTWNAYYYNSTNNSFPPLQFTPGEGTLDYKLDWYPKFYKHTILFFGSKLCVLLLNFDW